MVGKGELGFLGSRSCFGDVIGRAPTGAGYNRLTAGSMTDYHTNMSSAKIAITMRQELVSRIDRLVAARAFPNRSQAIQRAVEEKLERLEKSRLARECAKLDRKEEQALAEETGDLTEWPEY